MAPGTWTFVAFHEKGVPRPSELKDLSQNKDDLELNVFQGTPDAEAGRRFFVALCVALGVLVIVYVALHLIFHPSTKSFFWDPEPWYFLEVLSWALAGILVNLIITTGSYLRWGCFYREGIIMHISHLVTVPLLAAFAFLIGSRPWALWDFLQETAGKITRPRFSSRERGTSGRPSPVMPSPGNPHRQAPPGGVCAWA